MTPKTHKIVIDTREQKPWEFADYTTVTGTLKTGDYTIEGLEHLVCIERKGSTKELAANLLSDRFERELERMSHYKYKYLVLEFSADDFVNYPESIEEEYLKDRIKVTGKYLMRLLLQFQMKYGFQFIFAENSGEEWVLSIFKRVITFER